MALNEKQIFNRLNKAYENYFGNEDADEWFGSDDVTEWIFTRPRKGNDYKMILDTDTKIVSMYCRKTGTYCWDFCGNFS